MNEGFFNQFCRRELNSNLLWTTGAALGLTILAYLFSAIFKDRMMPFHSLGFLLATGAIFYLAMTVSFKHGLYLAAGMLTLIGLMWGLYMPMTFGEMALQLPLIGLFFVSICLLPNILPWMYEQEISALVERNATLEPKLAELRDRLQKLEQKETVERVALDRKEQIRISSRVTFINAFAREVLQASSNRELLNLLFHNMLKLLQPEECLLLVLADETKEVVVARALHANHEKLENSRIPFDNPLIAKVLSTRQPIGSVPPLPLIPGVVSRYIFPIVTEEEIVALYNLGNLKSSDLLPEDQEMVQVMATMVSGAAEQLKIATQTA